jgi:ADP-heptose:LPS heptosyltransferase
MSKKALIQRYGAYGDHLILSPVFRALKKEGYYVIFNTNQRGRDLFEGTSLVDEIIPHDEDMPNDALKDHWEKMRKEINPDYYKNFSRSLEINLALHPSQPLYIYPKAQRKEKCDKNYYEETERISGLIFDNYRPSIEYTKNEIEEAKKYIKPNFNLLWCLSGSGKNKTYPWTDYVMGSLIQKFPNINIITVGDFKCKILEFASLPAKNFTELAGEVPIKLSMALTSLVNVVVSPDTAVLHASGAYDTPKVGLLGHTTKENITKHFKNDYSIEAYCACSPCFRLIYDHTVQCPCDFVSGAAWCMSSIEPETVYYQILKAYDKSKNLRNL